jgi:hypothetical protein
MKKIVGILIILMLGSVLVMPVSAGAIEDLSPSLSLPITSLTGDPIFNVRAGQEIVLHIIMTPFISVYPWPPLDPIYDLITWDVIVGGPGFEYLGWGSDFHQEWWDPMVGDIPITGKIREDVQAGTDLFFSVVGEFTARNVSSGRMEGMTYGDVAMLRVVPEFPSPFLPGITIIGFLGTALYLRKNKEN